MPTYIDDLAQTIWKEHFDGLNADYGPKFCKRVVETVLSYNLNNYSSFEGIMTIGDLVRMWENGDVERVDLCDDDDYDVGDCNGPVAYLGPPRV